MPTPIAAKLLAIAVFASLLLTAGCGAAESADDPLAGAGAEQGSASTEVEPSAFAQRQIPEDLLSRYIETGADRGLDWSILAATDLTESSTAGDADPTPDGERISAIAYALLATGAPDSYEIALATRGGTRRFASQVLGLADRLRALPETAERIEPTEGPFSSPVEGPVVAGYGRAFGLLHDGADIEAPTGTPIGAAADGVVTGVGYDAAFGNYTCIVHRLEPAIQGRGSVSTCYGINPRSAWKRGNGSVAARRSGSWVAAVPAFGLTSTSR